MTGSQRGKRKEYEKLTKTVSASESRASPATSMSLAHQDMMLQHAVAARTQLTSSTVLR